MNSVFFIYSLFYTDKLLCQGSFRLFPALLFCIWSLFAAHTNFSDTSHRWDSILFMNPPSWVHIDCQNYFKLLYDLNTPNPKSRMYFIKLLNYEKISGTNHRFKERHKCGGSGAKTYYKCCCYWVWQLLTRIISSCCSQSEKKKVFSPTIGMKALRSAVHLLFHLLSSSKQLNACDTLQWELHIPETSCHRRFHAITSCCGDIGGRAGLTLVSTTLLFCHSIMPSLPFSPSHHEKVILYFVKRNVGYD